MLDKALQEGHCRRAIGLLLYGLAWTILESGIAIYAETLPPAASNLPTQAPTLPKQISQESAKKIKPGFVTLTLNQGASEDTEIIQWPDGGFSVPVKTFLRFFDIEAQQSDTDQRLLFLDAVTRKTVEIDWGLQRIKVNDEPVSTGEHPIVRSTEGLLVPDDIYIDQTVLAKLLEVSFTFDSDATTLHLTAKRKLKASGSANADNDSKETPDYNTQIIRNPEIKRALIEKIYIHNTSTYNYQNAQQPTGAGNRIQNQYVAALIDSPSLGFSGSVLGQDYHFKPSFIRYNGKTNFQDVDWSIEHGFKRNALSLGSTDAGLSSLVSPTLRIWGLKLASRNASAPYLSPQSAYEFTGRTTPGNQVSLHINNRTVEASVDADGVYEFDPVYLQPNTINQISISEKDSQNHEKLLLEKTIAAFPNLLPKGETGYSAFLGRTPLQFYPILPDQKTPFLMPQSEKWLTGARLFYGLSHRLTVGVSATADHIFGKPKSYFSFLNPLYADLTGYNSYQRDPNYLNGGNLGLTLRYQLRDRWSLGLDGGLSQFNLKRGSLLDIPTSNSGKAFQVHLERQGSAATVFLDAFRYDPYYYTPATVLYGNTLYDRQGLGTGINGTLQKYLPIDYSVKYSRFKSNLEQLIPGGFINTNQWSGNITGRLNASTNLGVSFNWLKGANREREFMQRSLDVALSTQSLPWKIGGELRLSHYQTNNLFYPSSVLGSASSNAEYTNNSITTLLDIPLQKSRLNHIKLGNRISTFVDYGYLQGFFQYRQLFCEPFFQKSYGEKLQSQDRLGLKLGYQFRNGTRFSVSYFKNMSSFGNVQGSGPLSKVNSDQFYVDFTDVLGLLGNRPRLLGPNAETDSMITGQVFADYQANGKRDKTEPGVRNIQLLVDKQKLVTTDQHGLFVVAGLSSGYHTLEILPDKLPLSLSSENPIYKIKTQIGKAHRLNLALVPEGGALRGQVLLVNIDNQSIDPKGLILVLTTAEGRTINYTAVDESGRYKFSNVPPGKYQIDLEQKIKTSGRYKVLETLNNLILIQPQNYEEVNELKNLNLKLLAL